MNKRYFIVFATCVLLVAVLASVFVTSSVQNAIAKNELTDTLKQHADDAKTDFSEYVQTGKESYYISAVSSFYAFQQTYLSRKGSDSNYLFMNEVYGYLVLTPDEAKTHASELAEVMRILSEDPFHANGYHKLSSLRNALKD